MFYVKQTATDADWSRETDTGPKCNAAWQNCTFPVEARTHTGFIWVLCSGAVLWFVVGTSRWVEMGRDVWVCAQVRVHVYWMNDFSIARLLPEEACNRLCPLLQGRSKLSAARHWARAPSGSVCVCVLLLLQFLRLLISLFSESGAHTGLGDGVWRMEGTWERDEWRKSFWIIPISLSFALCCIIYLMGYWTGVRAIVKYIRRGHAAFEERSELIIFQSPTRNKQRKLRLNVLGRGMVCRIRVQLTSSVHGVSN